MRYAVAFLVLSGACGLLAFQDRGLAWILAWPAVSFLAVALAYGVFGPRILGKRADGSLAPASVALLLPHFLFTWLTWHVQRLISREPCHTELLTGLWIGRRAYLAELPIETTCVVDLTSEFSEPRAVRRDRQYICLPTLGGTAIDERALREIVEQLAPLRETIYIHCAQGHGRSAALAAALLIRRGAVHSVEEAEQLLRRARPGVRLSRRQRGRLESFVADQRVPT